MHLCVVKTDLQTWEEMREKILAPRPRMICARLSTGAVVDLHKDCHCETHVHDGPHWLQADVELRASNVGLLMRGGGAMPSMLDFVAFGQEERARLRAKLYAMQSRGIVELLSEDDVLALRAGGASLAA